MCNNPEHIKEFQKINERLDSIEKLAKRKRVIQVFSKDTPVSFTVGFLMIVLSGVIGGTIWVSNTTSRVALIEQTQQANIEHLKSLDTDTNVQKIQYAEIQTQLKNIDTTLVEIKQKLGG